MKNKIFHFLLLSAFFLQCQNKKNEKLNDATLETINTEQEKQHIMDLNRVQEFLENQKKVENEETEDEYNLTQKDLDILSDLIAQGLKNQGYKTVSDEEFLNKISNIFGINNKCLNFGEVSQRYSVYHGNLMDKKKETLENNLYESYTDTENLFFDKKNKLITNFMLLKNIVSRNGKEYLLNLPHLISARNKYLFNDSKPDLVWLKFNDSEFLETLVLTFGYTKDEDLLKWVLEKNQMILNSSKNNIEIFEKLLWQKDCLGNLNINRETFAAMHKYNKTSYPKYEDNLYEYVLFLNGFLNEKPNEKITFSEKAKITAYCLHFMQEETHDIFKYMGTFAEGFDHENNFTKEFEKNNYYNIPNFKKEWEEAKEEGNGIARIGEISKDETKKKNKVIMLYDRPDFSSFSKEIAATNDIEIVHQNSGWDFVKINGMSGYLSTEEKNEELRKDKEKKLSFLADEEDIKPEKKKGFWENLFG